MVHFPTFHRPEHQKACSHLTIRIRHPASSIQHQASSIEHRESSIKNLASSIQNRVSSIEKLFPNPLISNSLIHSRPSSHGSQATSHGSRAIHLPRPTPTASPAPYHLSTSTTPQIATSDNLLTAHLLTSHEPRETSNELKSLTPLTHSHTLPPSHTLSLSLSTASLARTPQRPIIYSLSLNALSYLHAPHATNRAPRATTHP
jgi:hypothetical protein